MAAHERIICALDVDSIESAVTLVTQLKDHVGVFKIGLELATSAGLPIFEAARNAGAARIFYDAKLHDIPNTVAGAMRGVTRLGAWCVTVHATGGTAMLQAAVQMAHCEAEATGLPRPKVLAVTVLTSLSPETLRDELRVPTPMSDYVAHLAKLAHESGCDGVVTSPHEIEAVRAVLPSPDFLVVTPGVRPAGVDKGDQARVMTPGEAIARGASYLVIGRAITAAPDPVAAAQAIAAEIS